MSEQVQYTTDEYTMLELLNYPNTEGLHANEIRWRNLARKLKQRLVSESMRAEGLQSINASLAAEVDRQRPVVEAAVEWRRYGYERKADFCVGISPLLDAIDIYDIGAKRPCEEMR